MADSPEHTPIAANADTHTALKEAAEAATGTQQITRNSLATPQEQAAPLYFTQQNKTAHPAADYIFPDKSPGVAAAEKVDEFLKNYSQSIEQNPGIVRMFAELQQKCHARGIKVRAGGIGEKDGEMVIYLETNKGAIQSYFEVSHLNMNEKTELINKTFNNIANARETVQSLTQPALKKAFKDCLTANPDARKILNRILVDIQKNPVSSDFFGGRDAPAAIEIHSGPIPLCKVNIADIAQIPHHTDLISTISNQILPYLKDEIAMTKIHS